jgi:S-adenosylmethionine decarboxylase
MENIAPDIIRKRLLMEGFFDIDVTKKTLEEFFSSITEHLSLRMYGEPIIFSPGGDGKEENQGFDAFVPLIDSGISVYVWSNKKFFSIIIYTCKDFDEQMAIEFTKNFYKSERIIFESF